eukprot:CAMPEP_0173440454 /NCGR_PEP_ID=MMETSP1357-20121228/22908_1 /TAXON_ID=77926 /ORGANISM="Hemiselmis rufescens, Strain PCC563" /LENGTH=145 /DNA_ID=CAMNT_0014405931 /DNA_START=142 /DNA_END=579 /DNA_ORIENTATION=+
MRSREAAAPRSLLGEKFAHFRPHIRTAEEAKALIQRKLEKNPMQRSMARKQEHYYEYSRDGPRQSKRGPSRHFDYLNTSPEPNRERASTALSSHSQGRASSAFWDEPSERLDGTRGWRESSKSFVKGKHVTDPNSAWMPHFIAGV